MRVPFHTCLIFDRQYLIQCTDNNLFDIDRVRECQIVLLAGTKGCFIPAPYVDSYGETDQGLRYGIKCYNGMVFVSLLLISMHFFLSKMYMTVCYLLMCFRRGNPLHLCKDSYKNLQKMWFTHCIPETVAHNIESHMNLMSIHWQHL